MMTSPPPMRTSNWLNAVCDWPCCWQALVAKAGIAVSEDDLMQKVAKQARLFPGEERQYIELVAENAFMQQRIQSSLFEEKVINYAFELVEVTEKPTSKDDLEKAFDAMEAEDT